jgi:hypothetical protein
MKRIALAATIALATLSPRAASAFCGFYVTGADAKLFNDATQVVMMRDGNKTILSMANNYQGPPADFAMVVPVPVVLRKQNVKTLPTELFDHVDQLTSPRLVEYWEQDPCMVQRPMMEPMPGMAAPSSVQASADSATERRGVKIEAKFSVGEYDIVILSAKDSGGLDTWLHEEGYKIPNGAEPLLRPYVTQGMKFFVAKVDVKKVKMKGNATMLSPLRFHFDSDAFFLPIRLGLANSSGTQDLIVNVLARGKRYEVANYDNVAIPTNINVSDQVRSQFGAFYAALFDKTIANKPRAVVTEYSWDAGSCDPCPGPTLTGEEIMSLGADVISEDEDDQSAYQYGGGFVVTRLHLRYSKASLGDDLFFRPAAPIEGGRESMGANGEIERGAKPGSINNFQARYAIRHPWTGAINCENPRRGIWGGPPNGGGIATSAATNLAFAPRGNVQLGALIKDDSPEAMLLSQGDPTPPLKIPPGGGCAGCAVGASGEEIAGGAFGVLALVSWLRRRRGRE